MMWLMVRCMEEISVSALAKLASAITDAAHRETGVPIGDIRVEFRSYIPDSTYYTGANIEALQYARAIEILLPPRHACGTRPQACLCLFGGSQEVDIVILSR